MWGPYQAEITSWSELIWVSLMTLNPKTHKEGACGSDNNSNSCRRLNNGSPNMSTFESMQSVNVTLQGKRDFAGVIELRLLRWWQYPGLSRWVEYNHKCLQKRETRGVKQRARQWWKQRDREKGWRGRFWNATQLALKVEEGTLSQKMFVALRS